MKEKYLLNFGDSWAAGHNNKLIPFAKDEIYSGQLAIKLGYNLLDFSCGSTSAHHMILEFQKFIKHHYDKDHEYIAIFFITAQERQISWMPHDNPIEVSPNQEEWKEYYQNFYTDTLGEFNLNTTILSLQTMCKHYGINDRYILGWQYPRMWSEVDLTRFYKNGKENCFDLLVGKTLGKTNNVDPSVKYPVVRWMLQQIGSKNKNFNDNDGHPSVQGHTMIAEELYLWINRLSTNTNP